MLSNNDDVDTDNMSEGGGDDTEAYGRAVNTRGNGGKIGQCGKQTVPIPTYVAV